MDMVPWKPFKELSSLRKEMDNLLKSFFSETSLPGPFARDWAPPVDVSETEDSILIKAEIPGLEAKDISVTLLGDRLTIKGEKRKEEERKDEHFHSSERFYGSFERSFRLPASVKADKVEAAFDKGILTVSLPKTEEAKSKEIKIKVK
jgi:HSP20 family protein